MSFVLLNYHVAELVDIFANSVLKNPGINKNKKIFEDDILVLFNDL